MAAHSSILAWRIPWTEEPGRLQSIGLQRVNMTKATYHAHTHRLCKMQNPVSGLKDKSVYVHVF